MGGIWTALLNGGALGAGSLVARYGFRQSAGWPRTLASALLGWAWLTIGMEALGPLGLLERGPLLGWIGAGLLIGMACWMMRRRELTRVEVRPSAIRASWGEMVSASLILWAGANFAAQSLFLPVKVMSDAPIYHLYFAARWWKSGRLDLIATPFGESAAPYFPAVGDLWFTWLMIGWGGDRLARIGQTPFLLLAGLTTFALCRRLGAGRPTSLIAVSWFVTCTPFFVFSFESNVDTVMVAGYLLTCYFLLRYALGDDGLGSLVLGTLGAGLALGTKAPAIVFVTPLLALAAVLAIGKGRGIAGKLLALATVLLVPLTVAGFWWARNLVLTGNPLYPLHLEAFGRVCLAGWYGPEVMRLSPYYVDVKDWRTGIDLLMAIVDPRMTPVWLAALAGVWALGLKQRSSENRWVWVASALAVLNIALFWVMVPYRTQYRFMYQGLGLAAIPLARTFERGRAVRWLGVGLLVIHMVTRAGWPIDEMSPPWDLNPRVPNNLPPLIPTFPTSLSRFRDVANAPFKLLPVFFSVVLGMTALATVVATCRARERLSLGRVALALLAGSGMIGVVLALVYPWESKPWQTFCPAFSDYYRGWLALEARSGPTGARVAYAGTDLPYYLMGVGLRNEVRYINVDNHRDWLLHDYHRAASLGLGSRPATWETTRPGWDRLHPNYESWLANLRAERIQLLVVTHANPDEGAHNVASPEGFPIERVWADMHPEAFERLYPVAEHDPLFRLYRVKPSRPGGP